MQNDNYITHTVNGVYSALYTKYRAAHKNVHPQNTITGALLAYEHQDVQIRAAVLLEDMII